MVQWVFAATLPWRCCLLAEAVNSGLCEIELVGAAGPVATELLEALTGVQQEKIQDSFGWVVPVVEN